VSQPSSTPEAEPRVDVLAFGSVFLEIVFGHISRLPGAGEEVFSDQFALSCGGAISVATAAARSGANAGLVAVLGDDFGTQVAVAHCERAGVDLSASRWVSGPASGVTAVVNFDDDRAFISHIPNGPDLEGGSARTWWPAVVERHRPRWIYLHARPAALDVIAAARRVGCRVALDTELATIRHNPAMVRSCVALADLFTPNRRELLELTQQPDVTGAATDLSMAGTVVVKEGAEGATIVADGTLLRVTAGITAVDVQDRTGAGDAFAGTIIGSLAQGVDLLSAVEAGNAAGSAAVARLGALGPMDFGPSNFGPTAVDPTERKRP
jgi:sugar/nucleoside kinase (ribokinase family)